MAFGSNLMATLMTQAFFPCLEFYFLGLNLTIFWLLPSYVFIQTNMYIVYHCIKKFSLEDYA
jgi:hypothetical protein